MKTDVVIIGAGISGLATGALLARAGKRVVVLEKGNQAGGRAYAHEEKGFTLNYGAHGMYIPESGPLGELNHRLGIPVPRNGYPDAMRSYWALGDRFGVIGSKASQVLTTSLFSVRSRLAFAKLMLAVRGEKAERLPNAMTWGEYVASKTADKAVRQFMMAFATINTYSHPADGLSAKWFITHVQRAIFAKDYVGYMFGGWGVMYGAWANLIESHGGHIVTGARVRELETDAGRIVAAVTEQARYEADAFVSTLPPQDAPTLAADGSTLHGELSQWSGLDDVRAYCIDLGFDRRLRDDLTLAFDADRDLYYSIHSETATDLAPEGCWLMHALAYLSPEEARDESLREKRRDELIGGLDRFFPGWRDAVVIERTIPDARVVGARRTPEQIAKLVPVRASSVENLYFANDARDLDYNISLTCLVAAMEVADAIGARATSPVAAAVA